MYIHWFSFSYILHFSNASSTIEQRYPNRVAFTQTTQNKIFNNFMFFMLLMKSLLRRRIHMTLKEPSWYDPTIWLKHLNDMITRNDILCIEQLHMDRRCFRILCSLVREYGVLQDTKNMNVEEMVAIFLHIIAFDEKNWEIKFSF